MDWPVLVRTLEGMLYGIISISSLVFQAANSRVQLEQGNPPSHWLDRVSIHVHYTIA